MKISFVIYFHSSRIENLKQQLRFLKNRENTSDCEIIIVCQNEFKQNIYGINPINLKLNSYHKTKMCNMGVDLAKNDIVALLDSDRIFPKNYFEKVFNCINPSEFVSTWKMYKLMRDYCDEEIEENRTEKKEDFKSKENKACEKNLFAGSTIFFKKDYLDIGGMDEKYEGYGFADSDMTANVLSKGYKAIWNDEEELHLHHSKTISWNGELVEFFPEVSTSFNAIRYHKKWNLPINKETKFLIEWVKKNFDSFPDAIKKEPKFKSIYKPKIYA